LLKDFANTSKTNRAAELFKAAIMIVNTINDSERIRAEVQHEQLSMYGKVFSLVTVTCP
jgi:hypothetical protein